MRSDRRSRASLQLEILVGEAVLGVQGLEELRHPLDRVGQRHGEWRLGKWMERGRVCCVGGWCRARGLKCVDGAGQGQATADPPPHTHLHVVGHRLEQRLQARFVRVGHDGQLVTTAGHLALGLRHGLLHWVGRGGGCETTKGSIGKEREGKQQQQ